MMSRAAEASDETTTLLRATFFEAHADKQRIITTTHVEAAARRLGKGEAAVAALRDLVLRDRLPLVRLLHAEPLQELREGVRLAAGTVEVGRGEVTQPGPGGVDHLLRRERVSWMPEQDPPQRAHLAL